MMDEIEVILSDKTYTISRALVEGLESMGALRELDLSKVNKDFHEPLTKLFGYAKKRMARGGRDRHLPKLIEKIFSSEPNAASWVEDSDMKHTVASFGYLAEICSEETFAQYEKKRMLSAMLVHDCAYPIADDFNAFTSSEIRLLHMQEAEKEFRTFAGLINSEFKGFYSDEDVEFICSIVRQHDNPSVKMNGKPLDFEYDQELLKPMWAHREADRLWMLDKAGFALDLTRRLVESNSWYNPKKYLEHVILRHKKEAEVYKDNPLCFHHHGDKTLYRTFSGFTLFNKLVKERAKEYGIKL